MKTNPALQSTAEEYARIWIVAAYKRLILTMDNPDDVASAFEVAFIDGYLTGQTHERELSAQMVSAQIALLSQIEYELLMLNPPISLAKPNLADAREALAAFQSAKEGGE